MAGPRAASNANALLSHQMLVARCAVALTGQSETNIGGMSKVES